MISDALRLKLFDIFNFKLYYFLIFQLIEELYLELLKF